MNFRLGCAIWAYKGWVGDLFPPESYPGGFLRLYSQRFTPVEGNTTFYSIPDAETIARWAKETPTGFQFRLKLPKWLTQGTRIYFFVHCSVEARSPTNSETPQKTECFSGKSPD